MRAVKQKTEKRKAQIGEATMEAIAEKGLSDLSVADVARRVGIVPSGIYRHYPGKDALIDAALDAIEARHEREAQAVKHEAGGNAVAQLRTLFSEHLDMIQANAAIPRVVFGRDLHAGHPGRRERLLKIFARYQQRVASIIEQGQREGCFRKDLDPLAAARLFLGLVQPSAFLWSLSDGKLNVKAQAEAAWPLLLRAICSGASPRGAVHENDHFPH